MKLLKAKYIPTAIGLFCAGLLILTQNSASAATFNQNNVIDDAVFNNSSTMDAAQIDAFLNSQPSSCISTNRGFTAPNVLGYNPSQGFIYGASVSAGTVINNASKAYDLNPQVILATLQKEQSLVTGGAGCHYETPPLLNPCPEKPYGTVNPCITGCQYAGGCVYIAMGYDCPYYCAPRSIGFSAQIVKAAWKLKFVQQRSLGNYNWNIQKPGWDNSDDPQTPYDGYMTQGYLKRNAWSDPAPFDGYRPLNGNSITVHLDNGATASLYSYTPFISGGQSFFNKFTDWFGSTYAFIYNGVSYVSVFDPEYYLTQYPDLQAAFGNNQINAFNHFIYYGMNEKRQGNANFNVTSYRNLYTDLRVAFENNLPAYYLHYIQNGKAEGRIATGNITIQYITSYAGFNYSDVYDFQAYKSNNSDIQSIYNDDDAGAIRHFATYGMKERRIAKSNFNMTNYKNTYPDLRYAFGNNFPSYYLHYIQNGKTEGRVTTSSTMNYYSAINGTDYSDVYSFTTYKNNYSDINSIFGNDDLAALKHFIQHGMNEGRQANSNFNVTIYKQRYADLQQAFGNYLPAYYQHYIQYGKAEGRTAI